MGELLGCKVIRKDKMTITTLLFGLIFVRNRAEVGDRRHGDGRRVVHATIT